MNKIKSMSKNVGTINSVKISHKTVLATLVAVSLLAGSIVLLNALAPKTSSKNTKTAGIGPLISINQGLVAEWTFDNESAPVFDSSGHGNDLENSGATFEESFKGKAARIDKDDSASLKLNKQLPLLQSMSLSFWMNTSGQTDKDNKIISAGGIFYLYLKNYGEKGIWGNLSNQNSSAISLIGSQEVILNQWNHCVITYDSSTKKISGYLNGKKKSEQSINVSTINLSNLIIGNESANKFDGSIDEVRIYDRKISDEEIALLYSIKGFWESVMKTNQDYHYADTDKDYMINLQELLRVTQFFNMKGYSCSSEKTIDGYQPGPGKDKKCVPHTADINKNFIIELQELLRVIQFKNLGGYHLPKPTETTEDGFIAGYPECISDPDCSVGNICIRNYCISKVLPEPTASTIPGDLDGDNIVSNSDVQLFFDSVTNLAEQPDNLCAADLNGNGYLDGADGVIAMRLQNGSLTIEQLKTIRESLSLPALGCN